MDDKDLRIQELKAENEKLKKQMEELKKSNLDPIEMCKVKIALDQLKEYQRLEEQGLLLRLPCPIGTTVYEVTNHGVKGHWEEDKYFIDEWSGWIVRERAFNLFMFVDGVIGKTVFLTEQGAQATLEKMKAGGVNG